MTIRPRKMIVQLGSYNLHRYYLCDYAKVMVVRLYTIPMGTDLEIQIL